MKKLLSLILLVFTIYTAGAQKLPSVKVQDHDNKTFNTSSLVDGKTPFIISFWDASCAPCIKEIDTFAECYVDWYDEVPVRIIIVSIDDSRSAARARALVDGRGWSDFTALYDINQDLKRAMNVVLTPQVFVYDKDGNQVYTHTGFTPGSEEDLFDKVREL
ncbi:MAG: TlpA disulfide reductase family protein [Rikenellaceae bacterium]